MEQKNIKTKQERKNIDLTGYIGRKAKIVSAEIIDTKYGQALKVESEVVDTVKVSDEKQIELRASKLFNLANDEDGSLFIIKESKADVFLSQFGLDLPDYKKLIGKIVILITTEDKKWLTF